MRKRRGHKSTEIHYVLVTQLAVFKEKNLRFGLVLRWLVVMIHYLKNKVGVVDFANAQGLVMF